jgi:hypothetical protein
LAHGYQTASIDSIARLGLEASARRAEGRRLQLVARLASQGPGRLQALPDGGTRYMAPISAGRSFMRPQEAATHARATYGHRLFGKSGTG